MEKCPTAITANELQKSYKKVHVLRDVSFIVEKGTIFALLGANGSGKTTTINILTTLLNADNGTATVSGFDVATQAEEVRNHISLTGQFAAVDDVLTARENLVLIGELRHIKNPAGTAEALLKQFDLADAADRRSATFSGGMRRPILCISSLPLSSWTMTLRPSLGSRALRTSPASSNRLSIPVIAPVASPVRSAS